MKINIISLSRNIMLCNFYLCTPMLFDYNTDYTNIYLLQLSFIIIIMFTNKKMSISNLYLFFSLPQFPDKGTS